MQTERRAQSVVRLATLTQRTKLTPIRSIGDYVTNPSIVV